jgi:hypothetical protein
MPKITVEYSLDIQATAERLWDILTDVKSWPEWQGTSYIKPIPSSPVKGGMTFVAELGGTKWHITVTKSYRPNRVSWIGRRAGLKGVHEWEFLEKGGKTKAITRETMSGWMLPLLYPIVKTRMSKNDEKWLGDLKSRAEKFYVLH